MHSTLVCRAAIAATVVALLATTAPRAFAQVPAVPPQRTTAFVNVTVIPMDRQRTVERQTVIVRDGRIATIGPTASTTVPDDALRIDGTGKFLMPGIAEMHGHVPFQPGALANATMFLYVANGITTLRGMQGSPYHLTLREQVARGEVLGPRFYAAGPQMGANIRTPAIGDSVARAQKAAGYDLLKIQEGMPLAAYDVVVKTAKELRIPFGGHVPDSVGLLHALESGQGTIDHLDNYLETLSKTMTPATLAAITKRSGAAMVPTMPLWEILFIPPDSATLATRPELRYMPKATVATWFRTIAAGGRIQGDSARRAFKQGRLGMLRALNEARVPILLGTDAPQTFSVPGFSIHREMQSMVEAGMTPYQVMASGTRNVAVHFGTLKETGTVETGKRADLLLLDANPLTTVANVQRRAGVMLNGRWLPESEIQRGLEALAAGYSLAAVKTGDPVKRGLSAADFPRTRQLAPGVYSYEALRAGDPGAQMATVSLIVITSDGVLVADGQGNVAQTKEMVDWIAETTLQPIKYVVVCSDHSDHTGGNAAFPAGAIFIAHPTSKKVLEDAGKPPFPTEAVGDRRTIKLGGREIEIRFLGRAHTGGDLSVWLPAEKVLFMSEAYLHRIFPAMRSAYPSEWVQTVKNAEAIDATWFVPGHGFVDDAPTLKTELGVYRRAMEQVIAEATRLHAAKIPCASGPGAACEAAAKGNWGDLTGWTLYQAQLPVAIRKIYDELDGKLPPRSP